MKSCPTCNRTFEDTFTFCLVDGAILSAPFDPLSTRSIPEPRQTEPPPTEFLRPQEEIKQEIPPTIASPQPEQKPEELASTIAVPAPAFESPQSLDLPVQLEQKSKRSNWILIAIVMLITIGGIIGIIASRKQAKEVSLETQPQKIEPLTPAEQYAAKGEELANQSKYKEAEQEYRQAVNLEPNNPKWHRKLGAILYVNKNLAEAEAELKEAIRLNPRHYEYHLMLATILETQAETDYKKDVEAEAEYREAIRLSGKDGSFTGSFHGRLGRFFAKRARYAQAEAEFREAIRLEPDFKLYQEELADILDKQGKTEEAKAVREKIKQLESNSKK